MHNDTLTCPFATVDTLCLKCLNDSADGTVYTSSPSLITRNEMPCFTSPSIIRQPATLVAPPPFVYALNTWGAKIRGT